jgi:hypothetical protein
VTGNRDMCQCLLAMHTAICWDNEFHRAALAAFTAAFSSASFEST